MSAQKRAAILGRPYKRGETMRKTGNISVTLPKKLIDDICKLQDEEGQSCSNIVSEAVRQYCAKKEYRRLAGILSAEAKRVGIITEEDIDKAVHEVKALELKKKNSR